MALPARRENDHESQTYADLLRGSRGILVSFNKKSTHQQIGQRLRELKPNRIRELLKDRRARLQKLIDFIDIEASPRSFTTDFIIEMRDDFSKQIDIVIDKLPDPGKYIGNRTEMNKIFNLVGPTLDRVTDALEAIDIDDTSDIPAIIREKTNAYTELVTATEYLETGLSYWDLPMSQDEEEVDIEAYIQESGERLKTQKEAIDLIRGDLRSRGAREPFGKPALETYEFNLRKEVLATLLPIPQPKMLEDQALRNRITDSELHGYISNKGDIIRSLRNAKITLNLALDMHELIKPPLRLTRQHLGDHLTDCITYLGAALKDW